MVLSDSAGRAGCWCDVVQRDIAWDLDPKAEWDR